MIPFSNNVEAKKYLVTIGKMKDGDIDLFEVALAFSCINNASNDIDKYRFFIDECSKKLSRKFEESCATCNGDSVHVQASSLRQVMANEYAFIGDDVHYDDLKNIDIYSVVDRRMGLPVTLCIIAITIARKVGWNAQGVNFPGHFIMRLEKDGERLLIDPFQGCKVLEAKDLRLILKRVMGEYAEISSEYYNACTNREILLRLQNNMKYRLIDKEHYAEALKIVDTMSMIAPDDYRLFLDKSVLYARLDQTQAAIDNIEMYIASVPDIHDKSEAEDFLRQLRARLN